MKSTIVTLVCYLTYLTVSLESKINFFFRRCRKYEMTFTVSESIKVLIMGIKIPFSGVLPSFSDEDKTR